MHILKKIDIEIYEAIKQELDRQRNCLELIASENFPSLAVLLAQGSIMGNKYAEGYPSKRYYGGCQYMDVVETIAIERAKLLFHAEHANVQPHSGTQANMAVYFAVLNPGDTIMGMHLSHGGHLSHGHPTSFSGKYYKVVPINVRKTDQIIDYKELRRLAKKYKPKLIVAGSSSYSRIIDWEKFREVCDEINAYFLADVAHYAGLIAAGLYPSPVPYADFVTFTTHKTMRGPRGAIILCKKKYANLIDRTIFPGIQGGPMMHTIAAKAVALKEAMTEEFRLYQAKVLANARKLAECLSKKGYKIVSGGTDCHMFVVDLSPLKISGLDAQNMLESAGITVNKNSVPYDKRPPTETSGIRIGTPAVTTRGMRETEMVIIADLIDKVLKSHGSKNVITYVKTKVKQLLEKFKLYTQLNY
ncbi:MAG: serine hydroxymethyltransferase [Endomicrobia bacterium]|nr:serine hydroxymethyltransferase [Endomicrobiia bacterium]